MIAALAAAALDTLIRACAPGVAPRTMAAVVAVESGGHPYAVDDDDAHRSYEPPTRAGAAALAERLRQMGHRFDAGVAQINSSNFRAYGLTTDSVFDPCANLRAGGAILIEAYRRAAAAAGDGPGAARAALFGAFSIYNSGSPNAAPGYARRVFAAAGRALPPLDLPAADARPPKPRPGFSTAVPQAARAPALTLVPIDLAAIARRNGIP